MRPLVPAGMPIAVIAPSGAYAPEWLEAGLAVARAAGHVLVPFPELLQPTRYLAAPDDKRLADLTYALTSRRFGAVWAVRGGFGVTRLLGKLPWSKLHRKTVIGFSDLTPLLNVLWRQTGAIQVHGPVLHSLAETGPAARHHLFSLLAGEATAPLVGQTWHDGTVTAPLVGGNLTMLAATCGTPFQLRTEGTILVLEDVGEAPYRIDRMLTQLTQAGVLDGVAGIALGRFASCDAPKDASWSVDDVLRTHTEPLGVPVVADLPIGHIRDHHAVPIGAMATLKDGALSWEPPVHRT